MAIIYGKQLTKREILRRVGDISQLAAAKECTLQSGKSRGMRAVDVKTGSGLCFTVLPDRGMDIAWAEYKGVSLSFISKTGIVAPWYYEPSGNNFLRGFYGGLLTICGLTHMGAACLDNETLLGLHGRASNIPAEDVRVSNDWDGDEFMMTVSGRIRESMVFGENIALSREIRAKLGENRIFIKDRVENCGFSSQPLMLLYHFNLGYPVVDQGTRLVLPEGTVKARDEAAAKGIKHYQEFSAPVPGFSEQVFYHDPVPEADGRVAVGLFNESLLESGLGVTITYHREQLPYLIEWKQLGEGDYAVGIEPATWYPEGRSEARKRGELQLIEPGEIKLFEMEIAISEGITE